MEGWNVAWEIQDNQGAGRLEGGGGREQHTHHEEGLARLDFALRRRQNAFLFLYNLVLKLRSLPVIELRWCKDATRQKQKRTV